MYTFVLENLKLVIFWSPRAGSGSLFTFLKKYNLHSEDSEDINNQFYQIRNPQYFDNNYKKYLIVYNPYKRFLSFFRNKYLRSEIFNTKYPNRFENINNYLDFLLDFDYMDNKYDTNTEIHHVKNQISINTNYFVNFDNITIINIEKNYNDFYSDISFMIKNKPIILKEIPHENKGSLKLNIELKQNEYLKFNKIFKEDLDFFKKNNVDLTSASIKIIDN